jgi:hypothetical protein
LLADIAWSEVSFLLDHVLSETTERGVQRIHLVTTRFLTTLANAGGLKVFLSYEREAGFRLITDPRGGVRPRLIDAIAQAIQQEADNGYYRSPADPRTLADAMVSLGERFLYHGGDVDSEPDTDAASRMIALLVRELD